MRVYSSSFFNHCSANTIDCCNTPNLCSIFAIIPNVCSVVKGKKIPATVSSLMADKIYSVIFVNARILSKAAFSYSPNLSYATALSE